MHTQVEGLNCAAGGCLCARYAGPYAPVNSGPMGKYEGGFGPLLPFAQWPGVDRIKAVQADLKQLMATVDFVGVSNYARWVTAMSVELDMVQWWQCQAEAPPCLDPIGAVPIPKACNAVQSTNPLEMSSWLGSLLCVGNLALRACKQ